MLLLVSNEYPLYALSEEHQAIREAVRAICADKVAPWAAAVDEEARYPQEAHDALQAADFHAPHVPEQYGGAGADALATCLVIEEVARADVSASLIPAVNKLGSLPVQIGGGEAIKEKYLTRLAAGQGGFSYCLSEPDAGSDAAAMKTRAVRDGDDWVLDGVKRWISNAGVSEYYTVLAVTDPEKRTRGITAFVVEKSDTGVTFGAPEKKLGIKGSPTREVYLDQVRIPRRPDHRRGGPGLRASPCAPSTTPASPSPRRPSASPRARSTTRWTTPRSASSSGSPIAEFQGLQFMLADMGMKVEAARQMTYAAAGRSERNDPDLTFFGAAAKCFASDVAMEVTTDAVQVLGGYGFTRDYPVERMMRDAKITQIYEGTNQVQRIVMARQLLAGVQSQL